MLVALKAIIGAIFRRNWGGWLVPPHVVKVILGFAGSFLIGYLSIPNLYAAVAFGTIIGFAFLNPFHSWGMGMGFDGSGKSTLACAAVMGGSYFAFTGGAVAAVCWIMHGWYYAPYAASGLFVPFPYIAAWKWALKRGYPTKPFTFFKILGSWFIDSPTAIGECFLGAILWGFWYV